MLRLFVFLLCSIVLMLFGLDSSTSGTTQKGFQPCLSDDQLARRIISLSRNSNEAQDTQQLFREKARESSACRQQIIAAVIAAMDKPNLDISRDPAGYYLWSEGAVLLGDLKAVESLDFLLSHITMSDGEFSTTLRHQPALEGIIRMGALAIPKLKLLLKSDDSQTRYDAARCLFHIGGPSARQTLQQALRTETDRCVKRFIVVSLKLMRGIRPKPGEESSAVFCYA
jgi:HEAT repeat protein